MLTHQHSVLRGVLEWIVTFALVFVFFVFIRMFVIEPYRVPTGSMEPTIEVGDQVFAQKLTVNLGMDVSVGDIVVFKNPDGDADHDILVKRVIATGGQTVDLIGGVVYVDGQAIDEPYVEGSTYPLAAQAEGVSVGFPYTVPDPRIHATSVRFPKTTLSLSSCCGTGRSTGSASCSERAA